MARPAPILGHIFAGDAVTIEIPWGYIEAAIGIGACVTLGAVLGAIVTLLRRDGA